jgi:hypothetical protein
MGLLNGPPPNHLGNSCNAGDAPDDRAPADPQARHAVAIGADRDRRGPAIGLIV